MLTFGLSAASLLITPYVRPFWTQNDGAVVSLVRLGKDAELIHAAADSGYQESAQRVYELLLRVLAGYRDVAPHGMVISLTDVSAGDHKAGNSESFDARAFTSTCTAASEVRDGRFSST